MATIFKHTNFVDQTIEIDDDPGLRVTTSSCEPVTADVYLPEHDEPTAVLGLLHAILVASGMDGDYEITVKAGSEFGTAEELAAGIAQVKTRATA